MVRADTGRETGSNQQYITLVPHASSLAFSTPSHLILENSFTNWKFDTHGFSHWRCFSLFHSQALLGFRLISKTQDIGFSPDVVQHRQLAISKPVLSSHLRRLVLCHSSLPHPQRMPRLDLSYHHSTPSQSYNSYWVAILDFDGARARCPASTTTQRQAAQHQILHNKQVRPTVLLPSRMALVGHSYGPGRWIIASSLLYLSHPWLLVTSQSTSRLHQYLAGNQCWQSPQTSITG